jgi:hypothetical protein
MGMWLMTARATLHSYDVPDYCAAYKKRIKKLADSVDVDRKKFTQ